MLFLAKKPVDRHLIRSADRRLHLLAGEHGLEEPEHFARPRVDLGAEVVNRLGDS